MSTPTEVETENNGQLLSEALDDFKFSVRELLEQVKLHQARHFRELALSPRSEFATLFLASRLQIKFKLAVYVKDNRVWFLFFRPRADRPDKLVMDTTIRCSITPLASPPEDLPSSSMLRAWFLYPPGLEVIIKNGTYAGCRLTIPTRQQVTVDVKQVNGKPMFPEITFYNALLNESWIMRTTGNLHLKEQEYLVGVTEAVAVWQSQVSSLSRRKAIPQLLSNNNQPHPFMPLQILQQILAVTKALAQRPEPRAEGFFWESVVPAYQSQTDVSSITLRLNKKTNHGEYVQVASDGESPYQLKLDLIFTGNWEEGTGVQAEVHTRVPDILTHGSLHDAFREPFLKVVKEKESGRVDEVAACWSDAYVIRSNREIDGYIDRNIALILLNDGWFLFIGDFEVRTNPPSVVLKGGESAARPDEPWKWGELRDYVRNTLAIIENLTRAIAMTPAL